MTKANKMKYQFLLFCLLVFTACTQCSYSKREKNTQNEDQPRTEKIIKPVICR